MSTDTGRITLYIATSVDGFVADADGGVGWLDEYQTETDGVASGYDAFFAGVDCLVMGSATYEQVRGFGEWPYEDRPTYVVTRRDLPLAAESVELVADDVERLAARLRAEYDHVWLVGGARLAQSFLGANGVDELHLALVPVLLGRGIPLFGEEGGTHDLSLLDTTAYGSGIVELRYRVGD